ncbi:nucleotide excision repair endonuclease [Bacillus infantis]|jgi:excinuclease UvrABC nuclease subunit|uniref:nucleotide excision repair endonuclease n=1 Tax=Bacillus infantis TaxID=324767 RepID=UPI001CD21FE2|nr:nucleotide excision repair endonuclease [Bacillus infantis]MCA1038592.1 nucleotide excision repair endonuclease [Bacillus infantis]MCR6611409.1 nucleotide excision repair endonuclease [Bacillus infantis]
MIKIEIPNPDLTLTKNKHADEQTSSVLSNLYGFTDYHRIPRDKGGLILFLDSNEDLMFVGKARKLRQRVKKHFEDTVSPIKDVRHDVYKIALIYVEDPMEREIYETYIINTLQAKYNTEKVFYK